MRIRKRLGEILVEAGLLNEDQLKKALAGQKRDNLKLGQHLVREGILTEDKIIEHISDQLKIPRYDDTAYPVDKSLAEHIPFDMAQKYQVVPLRKRFNLLTVAMTDPMDMTIIDAVEEHTGMEVEAVICAEYDLSQIMNATYGAQSGMVELMENLSDVTLDMQSEEAAEEDLQVSSLQNMAEEAPVIRLVNSIIAQAVREKASDVHISPEGKTVSLRFRIDGNLLEMPAPPKAMVLPVISRIKILSRMDIAMSRIPQDGRFTVKMDNKEINVRASVLPTIYGENLVLRLLDMGTGVYSLDRLGMSPGDRKKIETAIRKPYGMILSTGPTGSGKSTSLYSILRLVKTPQINIVTLEDPVEYRMEGIRQVQLNRKAGMTFASGLRSVLRQDPDVIMVGEIRDGETAGIATQSALTGHRVLSTVHTNDAAGAVTRFIDMGIEPFLVSSVLLVSFAQRLLRTICPYCTEKYTPPERALAAWGLDTYENPNFQRGRGCPRCMNTGYRGRTGVFEVLLVDEDIQELILRGSSSQEINRAAVAAGKLKLLKEDAADKVARGITTLEEAASKVMNLGEEE
ncbi:MAG: GspE/PulE family protein [Syntrophales bacterium]|nr:GspE/PulE family protein [Syntrophales bacterium]